VSSELIPCPRCGADNSPLVNRCAKCEARLYPAELINTFLIVSGVSLLAALILGAVGLWKVYDDADALQAMSGPVKGPALISFGILCALIGVACAVFALIEASRNR
jgi:hypothetical protein